MTRKIKDLLTKLYYPVSAVLLIAFWLILGTFIRLPRLLLIGLALMIYLPQDAFAYLVNRVASRNS